MWIWTEQLRLLGFRRKSERYWQCVNHFELGPSEHLSLFPWSEVHLAETGQTLVELDTFHVTFIHGVDHIHFYYHEQNDNVWEPGGHTSSREIRRHGQCPREMRARADRIAAAFIHALTGSMLPRRKKRS